MNLLDNAVKYSPDCKTVWIDETPENGCIAIRVRDRGVGIAPADRTAVFQKFFRGRGRQIDGVKGTGIGLADGAPYRPPHALTLYLIRDTLFNVPQAVLRSA